MQLGKKILFVLVAASLLSSSANAAQFLPNASLIDQSGKAFSFTSLRGSFVLLSFIYTRCRDAQECPLISAKFAQLQNRLPKNAHLVEVTIDPAYDRPTVLAAYAKSYGFRADRVTLLTGEPERVLAFASRLGVNAYTDPKYGFIHNENTVLVDPRGEIVETFPENSWTVDEIVSVVAHRGKNVVAWDAVDAAGIVAVVAAGIWIALRVTRVVAMRR